MNDLERRLGQLPRQVPPSHDLWPAIEARLGTPPIHRGSRPAAGRRRLVGVGSLLAAALLIAAVGVYGVLHDPAAVAGDAVVERPEPLVAVDPVARTARPFEAALEPLRESLQARREELSPQTLRVIDQQLAVIDQALAEVRRALAADPGDRRAERFFAGLYFTKVRLLEQASRLPAGT